MGNASLTKLWCYLLPPNCLLWEDKGGQNKKREKEGEKERKLRYNCGQVRNHVHLSIINTAVSKDNYCKVCSQWIKKQLSENAGIEHLVLYSL